jgi:hypothetical protein
LFRRHRVEGNAGHGGIRGPGGVAEGVVIVLVVIGVEGGREKRSLDVCLLRARKNGSRHVRVGSEEDVRAGV